MRACRRGARRRCEWRGAPAAASCARDAPRWTHLGGATEAARSRPAAAHRNHRCPAPGPWICQSACVPESLRLDFSGWTLPADLRSVASRASPTCSRYRSARAAFRTRYSEGKYHGTSPAQPQRTGSSLPEGPEVRTPHCWPLNPAPLIFLILGHLVPVEFWRSWTCRDLLQRRMNNGWMRSRCPVSAHCSRLKCQTNGAVPPRTRLPDSLNIDGAVCL